MSEQSLKIIIAGRTYPLTVKKKEEDAIRAAAEEINHSIKYLRENYAVKDMQDLLAMTALQLATKKPNQSAETNAANTEEDLAKIHQALEKLDEQL